MRSIAYWLSLLLIFSMPWDTAIETSSFGTLSRMLGLFVAAFWIFTVVFTKKIRTPHPFHILFFLFVSWHLLSVFWTIDLAKTMTRLSTYVQLFVLMYLVWDLYLTPTAIKAGLQAYVLGAWISVGGMIYNFNNNIRFTSIRYSAFGFDENNIGVILALGIPIAWYLGTGRYNKKFTDPIKLINLLYIPAALFSIFLTGSRGAFLAASPGFLYMLLSLGRLKPLTRVVVLVFIGMAIMAVIPYIPPVLIQRLSTTGSQISEGNLNGRVDIWVAGFNALAKNPFLGIGSSAFTSATSLDKAAHNSYLVVLFELGIVGFILLLLIMVVTAYHIFMHPQNVRYFWLSLLLVLGIGIFSLNWAHRKQNWIFPILTITSACLPVTQARLQRVPEPAADISKAGFESIT